MRKMTKFKRKFLEERLGAIQSPWDHRHYRVDSATLLQVTQLPVEYTELYDYSPTEVWPDQGDIGACVGHDGGIVMEITNTLLKEYVENGHPELLKYIAIDLSAGWLYHWSRYYANVPDYIEGSTNLGLMKALNKKGTATETDCPTDVQAPWDGINPKPDAEETAKQYAVDSYWNVNSNPNDVKSAIFGLTHEAPYKMPDGSQGKIPLVSAYPVYESFKDSYNNGIVPMPEKGERLLGGHSSCIIGWKVIDGIEYFINFNSWGGDVGDNGLFYIPTGYPFYPNDWWLVHNGPPGMNSNSSCTFGNSAARLLNLFPWTFRRRGRFQYLNPKG